MTAGETLGNAAGVDAHVDAVALAHTVVGNRRFNHDDGDVFRVGQCGGRQRNLEFGQHRLKLHDGSEILAAVPGPRQSDDQTISHEHVAAASLKMGHVGDARGQRLGRHQQRDE